MKTPPGWISSNLQSPQAREENSRFFQFANMPDRTEHLTNFIRQQVKNDASTNSTQRKVVLGTAAKPMDSSLEAAMDRPRPKPFVNLKSSKSQALIPILKTQAAKASKNQNFLNRVKQSMPNSPKEVMNQLSHRSRADGAGTLSTLVEGRIIGQRVNSSGKIVSTPQGSTRTVLFSKFREQKEQDSRKENEQIVFAQTSSPCTNEKQANIHTPLDQGVDYQPQNFTKECLKMISPRISGHDRITYPRKTKVQDETEQIGLEGVSI